MLDGNLKTMDLSEDRRLLLLINDSKKLKIYDMAIKKEIWNYEDHEDLISAHWITIPNKIILVSSGNVRILNIFLNLNKK